HPQERRQVPDVDDPRRIALRRPRTRSHRARGGDRAEPDTRAEREAADTPADEANRSHGSSFAVAATREEAGETATGRLASGQGGGRLERRQGSVEKPARTRDDRVTRRLSEGYFFTGFALTCRSRSVSVPPSLHAF